MDPCALRIATTAGRRRPAAAELVLVLRGNSAQRLDHKVKRSPDDLYAPRRRKLDIDGQMYTYFCAAASSFKVGVTTELGGTLGGWSSPGMGLVMVTLPPT